MNINIIVIILLSILTTNSFILNYYIYKGLCLKIIELRENGTLERK